MASDDDLERRVTALEAEMADVRTLAAGADADASRLDAAMRGQVRLLNALRETHAEHGQRLGRIESTVDTGFAEMRARFDVVQQGIAAIAVMLGGLTAEGGSPA